MRLIYKGVDITSAVDIRGAKYYDQAGGIADRLQIICADPANQWPLWGAEKGDQVEVISGALSTGALYVDELIYGNGSFALGAVSIPPGARQSRSKGWEEVRLYDLITEFSKAHGLDAFIFGVENQQYHRLSQIERADFEWLAWRGILEGAYLKIVNKKMILYGRPWAEQRTAAFSLNLADTEYSLSSQSTGIYSACRLESTVSASYTTSDGTGPTLRVPGPEVPHVAAYSIGEAERYAKNILLYFNRSETIMELVTDIREDATAGSVIHIAAPFVIASGKWFVECVMHDLIKRKTKLTMRRLMEVA